MLFVDSLRHCLELALSLYDDNPNLLLYLIYDHINDKFFALDFSYSNNVSFFQTNLHLVNCGKLLITDCKRALALSDFDSFATRLADILASSRNLGLHYVLSTLIY